MWYNNKAVEESLKGFRNHPKKLEKSFKKGIDKGATVWYNKQAVTERDGDQSSLKIEQQESILMTKVQRLRKFF